jgi:2-keto-4-pentenoate hydratase
MSNMGAAEHRRAAAALLEARRTRRWLEALPQGTRPANDFDAYAIQDLVARQLGTVLGWKVGSATLQSEPFRAPLHAPTLFENGDLPAQMFHVIGVEAEIVYRFGRDLPPRETAYTREEVLAAVSTMHPAIEIVDTRFVSISSLDALSQRADQQNHGALAIGAALKEWSDIDPLRQYVRLTINGRVACENIGGNSAIDPVRLLAWMANRGTHSLGGLKAGQAITTGSCTGTIFVEPSTSVRAEFPGIGTIEVYIG